MDTVWQGWWNIAHQLKEPGVQVDQVDQDQEKNKSETKTKSRIQDQDQDQEQDQDERARGGRRGLA